MELEDEGRAYRIIRQKFLNYRQFSCRLTQGKTTAIAAHALAYSTLSRKQAQGKIEYAVGDLHFMNRDEIRFITLDYYNRLAQSRFKDVKELIFNTPSFEIELTVRQKIIPLAYDLTPIIVVDAIPGGKLTLALDAKTYEDTKEYLTII